MEKSRNRDVRGVACLGLAEYLAIKAEIAEKPWFDDKEQMKDPFARSSSRGSDPAYFRYVRESRPREACAESWRLLERAVEGLWRRGLLAGPERPRQRRATIGEIARRLMSHFPAKVGAPAPEIDGEDLDGKPMKLSDYRGKVVVLGFWESAAPPCMAMVRRERTLADRLKDRPFVLLGVNADEDRDRPRRRSGRRSSPGGRGRMGSRA